MSFRISPIAFPGSLLKGQKPEKRKTFKRPGEVKTRKGRDLDAGYLALVRRLPCLSCDVDPAREAAHVRMTGAGKPMSGLGVKPSDRYALPLCSTCHTGSATAQHVVGEAKFWGDLGLDPLLICERLRSAAPSLEAMRAVAFKERETRR